jgi:hypothetical protein
MVCALVIGVWVCVSAILTLRDLSKYEHHKSRLKKIAIHMVVVGALIVKLLSVFLFCANFYCSYFVLDC